MSKEKIGNLILEELRRKKKVDFLFVRSATELPVEGRDTSVIGVYHRNTEEEEQMLTFLEGRFKKDFRVFPLRKEGLKGLSIAQ